MRAWQRRSSTTEPRTSGLAALCGLAALLWGPVIHAAPTVLLLRVDDGADRRWRAAEARTRDELRMMGLDVEELHVVDPERDEAAQVQRMLAEHGATAAVQLERDTEGGEARIWLPGPPGRLRSVRLAGLSLDGGEAATLAALRTVEVVHAGLLADAADDPPPAVVPASAAPVEPSLIPQPPASVAPAEPRADPQPPARPRLAVARTRGPALAGSHALAVQATVGGGPGGLGVLPGLALHYRRELPRIVAVQADLFGMMTPGWRTQGSGSIVMGMAGVRALLVVQARRGRRVTPRLGLGGGGAVVWATGRAQRPLRGVSDVVAAALLSASVSLAVRVRPRLHVVLGGGLDVLLQSIIVRVAGDERVRLGPATLHGSLGLEWLWPVARSRARGR